MLFTELKRTNSSRWLNVLQVQLPSNVQQCTMHMRESCLTQILHENLRVYVTKEAPSPSLRRKRKNTKTHLETNKHKGIYEFFPADSTRIPPLP